jgi:DNA modification methylase
MSEFELYHGDCFQIMDGLIDRVDVIIADPPYGLKGHGMRNAVAYMDISWDERISRKKMNDIIRHKKKTMIFGGNYYDLPPCRCFLVWDKGEGMYRRSWSECEYVWTNIDEPARIFKTDFRGKKLHPHQKPLNLLVWMIVNYSFPGDTILDPFMGSGTTGIACMKTGRRFVGIEKKKEYFDIAKERIENASLQPLLLHERKLPKEPTQAKLNL